MKKIICYGDSNTFGYNPESCNRYDANTRWTGVLAKTLGCDFAVAEEGCNNRTGFFKNSDGLQQSGKDYLQKCLNQHKHFEIFILALGTNDLQFFYNLNAEIAQQGLKDLINQIRNTNKDARIIIIPPVILCENVLNGYFNCQFDKNSIEKSISIQTTYHNVAREDKCELFDINKYVTPSNIDGLHFSKESHKIIAEQIAKQILEKNI